ncbi:hypothetical protein [Rhodococcus pyridinivorans]|uniref:Uncharacterized protein n=1 Tax=Rhodococcus pyridinivorans AK37 TaxID=1114960 RepID=H0JV27_9NOCA|nr:hypothetical protein [Rhodococcus pyridinivorans]EHK82123.1 hypothetical protein AK37_17790 [Rhodococcus pyridinivorans AK37]MCD2140428.1 hypothetical protein [Rhodococcus pyridinivorans]
MLGTHPLDTFREQIDTVAAAGGTVPDTYTTINQRWSRYLDIGHDTSALLADAITTPGDTSDLTQLRALALAERCGSIEQADLTKELKAPVLLALRNAYEPVADANYRTLADTFTATATAFTKAVNAADPDLPAEQMVTQSEKARKAWTDAAIHAAELDQQLTALRAAAVLAGLRAHDNDALLPLTVDTTGHHRRRLWEAWETNTGRTGKWGALARLGATIRAAHPDTFKPYRRPAPIEVKYMRGEGRYAGSVRVEIDPEDELV